MEKPLNPKSKKRGREVKELEYIEDTKKTSKYISEYINSEYDKQLRLTKISRSRRKQIGVAHQKWHETVDEHFEVERRQICQLEGTRNISEPAG